MMGRDATGDTMAGRLHRAPIWPGAVGCCSYQTRPTSCRPAGDPSLYGRDCARTLGNYAADYAARELFAATKSTLYRIVCRMIAG